MRDLHTLRPSDAAIDRELTPARREEIFQQVLVARTGIVPLSARRRRWPAAVAATVAGAAVVVLAVQVMVPQQGPLIAEPVPATSAPPSAAPTTATDPPSSVAPQPPVVLPMERLTAMAAEVEAATAPIAEGTFLHVETSEEQGPETSNWNIYNSYTDADGWTWTSRYGHINSWTLSRAGEAFASLPTDPAALDAEVRALGGSNSGDERVYREMVEILRSDSVPGDLRAAALLVLHSIAREAQPPETTKDGETATPVVTVTDDRTDGGDEARLRITFSDRTLTPGGKDWIILGAAGTFVERGSLSEDLTYQSVIVQREIVTELPEDFVLTLGTEQVEKYIEE